MCGVSGLTTDNQDRKAETMECNPVKMHSYYSAMEFLSWTN